MFIVYLPQTIDNYSNYRYVYHIFAINHSSYSNYRYVCYIFIIHPNVIAVINRHSYGAPPTIGMIFRTDKSLNLEMTGCTCWCLHMLGCTWIIWNHLYIDVECCFLDINLGCFKTANPCCDL